MYVHVCTGVMFEFDMLSLGHVPNITRHQLRDAHRLHCQHAPQCHESLLCPRHNTARTPTRTHAPTTRSWHHKVTATKASSCSFINRAHDLGVSTVHSTHCIGAGDDAHGSSAAATTSSTFAFPAKNSCTTPWSIALLPTFASSCIVSVVLMHFFSRRNFLRSHCKRYAPDPRPRVGHTSNCTFTGGGKLLGANETNVV